MTKQELIIKQGDLLRELAKVERDLQRYDRTLDIEDKNRPFCNWTLLDTAALFDYDAEIYNYFTEHPQMSITDYNAGQPIEERIKLEK